MDTPAYWLRLTSRIRCASTAAAAVLLAACAQGSSLPLNATPALPPADLVAGGGGYAVSAPELKRETAGFSATLLSASFYGGGSVGELQLVPRSVAGGLELEVQVSGARSLKALYLDLSYDQQRYAPLAAESTALMGRPYNVGQPDAAGAELLHLYVADGPGRLHYGQVLARPQAQPGFNGDGVMAVLHFTDGPAPAAAKLGAAAPQSDGSQAPLNVSPASWQVSWYYANQGDYDQNSETNIADLTPLAVHLGEVAPEGNGGRFNGNSELSIIDGDGNGEINIADITPIGQNFGCQVSGFNVYMGTQMDFPAGNGAASTLPGSGAVAFGDGSVREGESRLRYTFSAPAGGSDSVYWVRPFDGAAGDTGYEGTPSEMDGQSVAVIADNVRIIDGNKSDPAYDSEFELLSTDGTVFTVLDPPGGQDLNLGDVIVGFTYSPIDGAPDGGFIRRVSAVNDLGGGNFELDTTDEAGLGDIFIKGGLFKSGLDMGGALLTDFTPLLPKAGCAKMASATPTLKRVSAGGLIDFNIDGTVVVNKRDGDSYFTVTLPQANLSFTPSFKVDAGFDKFLGVPYDLNWFTAVAEGALSNNLEIVCDARWAGAFTEEAKLFTASKDFYFVVFSVPVLLTFTLDVYGGASGDANVDFHARSGYNLDYSVRLGVHYDEDDGWHLINEVSDVFSPIPPELRVNGEANIQVYLRPEISVALYRSLGGGFKLKPYASGHIDGNYDLLNGPFCAHWNLNGGFAADMFVYGKIFGISLFDKSWNLYDGQFEVSSGELGCVEGPQAPTAEYQAFGGASTTLPVDISLDATYYPPVPPFGAFGSFDGDGGSVEYPSGIKFYDWDFDSDGICDASGPIATITFTEKYVPRSVTLYVTDEEGMVSAITKDLEAVNPPT